MKTPITEIIEAIDFKAEMHVNKEVLLVLANLKSKALNLLEKEKEQIMNHFLNGKIDFEDSFYGKKSINREEYYNETYQNK